MNPNVRNKRFVTKKGKILYFSGTIPDSDELVQGIIENISSIGSSIRVECPTHISIGDLLSNVVIKDKDEKIHVAVGKVLICRIAEASIGVRTLDVNLPVTSILSPYLDAFGQNSWDVELNPE
ncbi:MAG: hypothetical protein OXT67_03845, partial [Zetaproteobacteria bacterium]|nr:hypothetical protein [Zetaproteobacteria bacterium]